MSSPLSPTDQFVDVNHYEDNPFTVYQRADGSVYKIVVSRYTGEKSVIEYANRAAYYAVKFDKAFDPEGKMHKGAEPSEPGGLRNSRLPAFFTK